jgi:valine--pyruvate aminotransferase
MLESLKGNELITTFQNWFKTETYSRLKLLKDGIIENLSYNYPVFLHYIRGGTSIWMYLKNLPLGDIAIANLLKSQGLIVNPGSFFYSDKLKGWKHTRECIHLNLNGCIGRELEVIDILCSVISKCYSSS